MSSINMRLLLTVFLAALAVGLVAGYLVIYKNRVNKTIRGEARPTHMPEPRNVWKFVVIIVLAVFLINAARDLKTDIENLRGEYLREINSLRSDISDLTSYIDQRITAQESLFASIDYECVETDLTKGTMTVKFTAVPKSYTQDTSVSVTFGEYTGALRGSSGVYTGTVEVSALEDLYFDNAVLSISEGGQSRTEVFTLDLQWAVTRFLPKVDVSILENECKRQGDVISLTLKAGVTIAVSELDVERVWALVEVDGEEVRKVDVTDEFTKDKNIRYATVDFSGEYSAPQDSGAVFSILYEDSTGSAPHRIDICRYNTDGVFEIFALPDYGI